MDNINSTGSRSKQVKPLLPWLKTPMAISIPVERFSFTPTVEWQLGNRSWRDEIQKFWSFLLLVLTAPVIWSVVIPIALLDMMATLYQRICFPVYGIGLVYRSDYVVMDRHKLSYLSPLEKLNCLYCGYGNGVLAYVREIASRTEERWCPIKHGKRPKSPHSRYDSFENYGDESGYQCRVQQKSSQ
ncbi:hypothetical protein Mmc1_2023 [Magnetococcus marinus MC-1]|uniref:Uncharacterized protein n=2 Tax=Magnetococcus TaxID=162171 RepID=A0L7B7_MAGMM|nr:hypothetical protein Mmc1_1349 [Magnetococcus marinus MC-1]ABK44524.1 hypothetical protein Mmc1_2023 [Magnetococcus marinus MC-1]